MRAKLLGHDIGYDDAGQGTPLLMMHAFPLDRRMFEHQISELSDAARLIIFDVPGAGESAAGEVSMDGIADIAAALLDHLRIEKAVVGGVSMGGYAAFAFVRRHPARLSGLVLANTRVAADTEEGKSARRAMAEVAIEMGSREIANRMMERLLAKTTCRERSAIVRKVRAMIESTPPETIARLLDALANREDSRTTLASIRVPTLVVAGDEDPLAPPEEVAEWAAKIAGAGFASIERAGHLACLEAPAEFNGLLTDFLRKMS